MAVAASYKVLSDPEARQAYDRYGHDGPSDAFPQQGQTGAEEEPQEQPQGQVQGDHRRLWFQGRHKLFDFQF